MENPRGTYCFPFLNFHPGIAQNNRITFYNLDSINGAPLGKINGITQDPSGYMWFCGQTQNCLYRYDGSSFIIYKHDNKNPNSLGFNTLLTVYADDDGMIWIGGNGLDRLDPATGIFTHYKLISLDSGSLHSGFVSVILKDHQGNVWVGKYDGLDRLDEKTGKFTHYYDNPGNPKSLSSNTVMSIYEDHKGVLWIGTGDPWDEKNPDGGLNRFNPDGTFTRYLRDPIDPHSLINNKVGAIFEDSRGNFWVGTAGDGLQIMDRENGTFERYPFDPRHPEHLSRSAIKQGDVADHITFICEDSIHTIWIGTYLGGISRYDPLSKITTRYKSGNGFPDSTTWNGFISRDGIFWVSTELSRTLFRADPVSKTISHIKTSGRVYWFLEDRNGWLWVATEGKGLLQYDEHKTLVHQFKHSSTDHSSIISDSVYCLYKKPNEDTIWIGTAHGVEVMNTSTKNFSRLEYHGKPADWFDYRLIDITEDKQGSLWFGSFGGGVLKYNRKNGLVKQWLPDPKDSGAIGSNMAATVFEDNEQNLWTGVIGGEAGIYKLNKQTDKFRGYLPGNLGIYMYEDHKGDLWAGMQTGLFRYNRKEDLFTPFFDSQSDISNKRVYGIAEDKDNNLWLSSPSATCKNKSCEERIFCL